MDKDVEYSLNDDDSNKEIVDYLTAKGFTFLNEHITGGIMSIIDKKGDYKGRLIMPWKTQADRRVKIFVPGFSRLEEVLDEYCRRNETNEVKG